MSHYATVSACQTSVICSDFSIMMMTSLSITRRYWWRPASLEKTELVSVLYRAAYLGQDAETSPPRIANFNTETYA